MINSLNPRNIHLSKGLLYTSEVRAKTTFSQLKCPTCGAGLVGDSGWLFSYHCGYAEQYVTNLDYTWEVKQECSSYLVESLTVLEIL